MKILRLISRYENARFALRLSARAETGGSMEFVITDELPSGYMQGSIELHSKIRLPRQTMNKGMRQSIENLVLQSGLLELPENETRGPLLSNGVEFMMLDGVHYEIEIFWLGKHKLLKRFNRPEPSFAKLFNSILPLALPDDSLIQIINMFTCDASNWDPLPSNPSAQT